VSSADDLRRRELAKIHCLRRDLGLDEDTYRDALEQIAGVRSASELDERGRQKVIEVLRHDAGKRGEYPGRPHNMKKRPELAKIEALLADSGRSWAYGEGIARRMYKKQRLAFCTPEELRGVITALVKDAQRRAARDA
jgi:phage gp16-like protein